MSVRGILCYARADACNRQLVRVPAALVQANCVVEIGPSAVTPARESPPALTARIRWAGDTQPAAQAVQRAWEHVQAHAGGSSAGSHGSSVADAHFREALLASSPLFVSISAPEVLADISRVRSACLTPWHHSPLMRPTPLF